jgi:hypothetical protein
MFEGTVFERTEKEILQRNVIRSNENNVPLETKMFPDDSRFCQRRYKKIKITHLII